LPPPWTSCSPHMVSGPCPSRPWLRSNGERRICSSPAASSEWWS
jgi:hypothetical protein